MDSAELLDLLGNENRRRILRLLSRRPCYVTEIGEYLDVSPKAVIDHLRKLEEAGLVEAQTDGSRRKYFHITRDVRLEVNVSRHGFGTKSAYPANPGMDLAGHCQHVRLEFDGLSENRSSPSDTGRSATDDDPADPTTAADATRGNGGRTTGRVETNGAGVTELAEEYDRLRELENELSLAQRWVRGRLSAVLDGFADRLGTDGDARLLADVVAAVVRTDGSTRSVVQAVDAPAPQVESALRQLRELDVLVRRDNRWEPR